MMLSALRKIKLNCFFLYLVDSFSRFPVFEFGVKEIKIQVPETEEMTTEMTKSLSFHDHGSLGTAVRDHFNAQHFFDCRVVSVQ